MGKNGVKAFLLFLCVFFRSMNVAFGSSSVP